MKFLWKIMKKLLKILACVGIVMIIGIVLIYVFNDKIEEHLANQFEHHLEQELEDLNDGDFEDIHLVENTGTVSTVTRPFEVHFIDVGQADCSLITYDTYTMLIDGGNVDDGQNVVEYLTSNGITELNYVVCTHAHEDHVGGLATVINSITVTNAVYAPETGADSKCYKNFVEAVESSGMSISHFTPNQSIHMGDCVVICAGPVKEDYSNINNTSIVLMVWSPYGSFMFTGDAEYEAETDMLETNPYFDYKCDVLKVGHHGSSSSTGYRWLREVNPQYAVISCGEGNKYGHPTEATLSRLRDADVQLYRTDMQGTIVATASESGISFRVEKNPDAKTNPTEKTPYYIGNTNSMKFHRPSCTYLPKEENRCIFNSLGEAYDAGFEPCGSCNP